MLSRRRLESHGAQPSALFGPSRPLSVKRVEVRERVGVEERGLRLVRHAEVIESISVDWSVDGGTVPVGAGS